MQDIKKIEQIYNSVSAGYAEMVFGEHEKKPKDQEILLRFSQEVADKSPLWDFGCGTGQTTKYLNSLGVKISGMDVSSEMLNQAKTYYPEIFFQKGDILKLEFDNASIAGIVSFYAIVHFSEDQVGMAFREIYRVLKPGGIFLFSYHIGEEMIHLDEFLGKKVDIDFLFFSTAFISCCLKDNGFLNIEVIERNPYPDVEYQSRRAYVFAHKPVV